jgi:hypothetical protein
MKVWGALTVIKLNDDDVDRKVRSRDMSDLMLTLTSHHFQFLVDSSSHLSFMGLPPQLFLVTILPYFSEYQLVLICQRHFTMGLNIRQLQVQSMVLCV